MTTVAGDEAKLFDPSWLTGIPSQIPDQADRKRIELWIIDAKSPARRVDQLELPRACVAGASESREVQGRGPQPKTAKPGEPVKFGAGEESVGWIGAPAWSADGRNVYFGKLILQDDGTSASSLQLCRSSPAGVEVVYQESTSQKEPVGLSVACSPNGRLVALQFGTSVRLIETGSGSLLAQLADATLPSWSPQGDRLAVHRLVPRAGVYLLQRPDFQASSLAYEVARMDQPVAWIQGGSAFLVARANQASARPDIPSRSFRLEVVEVGLPPSRPRVVHRVALDTRNDDPTVRCFLAVDAVTERWVTTVLQPGLPSLFELLGNRPMDRRRIWHPLDDELHELQIPLGPCALSPGGSLLAFRYGLPENGAPVGILELSSHRVTTLAVNDATAGRALWALVEAIKRAHRRREPTANKPFRVGKSIPVERRRQWARPAANPLEFFDRPSTQAGRDDTLKNTLDRLTEHGLRILSASNGSASPVFEYRRDELALLFYYLRGEYVEAMSAIDRLERRDLPSDARHAFDVVRLQCLIGNRDHAPARQLLRACWRAPAPSTELIDDRLDFALSGIEVPSPPIQSHPLQERLASLDDELANLPDE